MMIILIGVFPLIVGCGDEEGSGANVDTNNAMLDDTSIAYDTSLNADTSIASDTSLSADTSSETSPDAAVNDTEGDDVADTSPPRDTETDSSVSDTMDTSSPQDTDVGPPDEPTIEAYDCNDDPMPAVVLWVATDGDDGSGDGSEGNPWGTITHALDNASDGALILVKPGEYNGRIRMRGSFPEGVTVRSSVRYQARLRASGTVLTFYTHPSGVNGITVEGFDLAHSGAGASPLVVQIDGDGSNAVYGITLRDNILHDSFNNDILKINNGTRDVLIERNIFYNQTGSDEHIDINSAEEIVIQDNIFMSDFAGSGRGNNNDTSSFIVVKDSNGSSDIYTGSAQIILRRNIFMNYEGSTGTGFVLFGEDGQPFFEVDGGVVENNLFIGNSTHPMRAPLGIKGCRDILVRNNTVVGDLPARSFAMRINIEGSNRPSEEIRFFNNIWSDPSGSMGALDASDGDDFSDTNPAHIVSFQLNNNLYFNGGGPIPSDGLEAINPSDDAAAINADPLLGEQSGLIIPRWDMDAGQFADGSMTTCEVFTRLVVNYGTPSMGSEAIDAANFSESASDDILGRPRAEAPDIGAVEVQ